MIEQAKRIHSQLRFSIYIYVEATYVKCALFRVLSNAPVLTTQKIKGLKLNRKQAQRAGGIKSVLAILHQSTTLSKL